MNKKDSVHDNPDIISYINKSFRMSYFKQQNIKKVFWWWLNKFEYLARLTCVPYDEMDKLFIKMVNKNIYMRVKKINPSIDFTELSYEEIINHHICFFKYSPEILLQRKPFKDQNHYERRAIEKYATYLQDFYYNDINRSTLEISITAKFVYNFKELEITKHLEEIPDLKLRKIVANKISKSIELARYINPALSMIQIYNSKNTDNFYEWLNKFEYVANIIKVSDDKMLEFFNRMVDNDILLTVKKTHASINLSELTYEETINLYLQYYAPSDDSDVHKIRILHRKQYKEETIEDYANSLRKLSKKCINKSELNEILLEQFLNGINDKEIKTIPKNLYGFTFDEMVEFAIELSNLQKIASYQKPAPTIIQIYNEENGDKIFEWLNKFEYIADSLELSGKRMAQFFQSMVHSELHTTIKKRNKRVKILELPYERIVNLYFSYLCKSNSIYLNRERLTYRKQYENETIESFANCLRRIEYHCLFQDCSDEKLCDQFRAGIRDEKIKNYLMNYPNLSFNLTLAIAIAYSIELSLMENE